MATIDATEAHLTAHEELRAFCVQVWTLRKQNNRDTEFVGVQTSLSDG
jgi:hypothetical protein